jgi:hypothetical protein
MTETKNTKTVIFIWGRGKVGKTILVSQFPNPVFICVGEAGLGSVRSMRAALKLDFDFDAFVLDDTKTVDEDFIKLCGAQIAGATCWSKVKRLVFMLVKGMPEDSFLIIDHYSNLIAALTYHICHKTGHDMQIQDWGTFIDEMSELIGYLKLNTTKCNSIILFHDEAMKDEVSGSIMRTLLSPTKLRNTLPTAPDEYLYMKAVSRGAANVRYTERVLQAVMDESTNTGSRSLMPDIINPTYAKIKPYLEAFLGRELPPPTWTPPEPKAPSKAEQKGLAFKGGKMVSDEQTEKPPESPNKDNNLD